MMSLPKIFGLTLLFLFFESAVVVATRVFLPKTDIFVACLAMTGLGVGAFVILYILPRLFTRRTPKPVAERKAPVPVKANQVDEAFKLELGLLIAEADRHLKVMLPATAKSEPPRVSSLPVYLVLGAEGSGKTSLILNSGLDPVLIAGEAEKDGSVMPTSIGNIWYAKQGCLFVEIAGRHLMQDAGRWQSALGALAQRPHVRGWRRILRALPAPSANLRGVILACDVGPLLTAEEQGRAASIARTLNQRLQSIQTLMRPDFPAYVFFTKCDSIPYFKDFFSRFGDPEARRILGVTLQPDREASARGAAYAEREGSRLNKLFNRLYQSLADKRMLVLAREESVEKRAGAFEFPREFRKLRNEIVLMLLDLFRPSALASTCRFRGFYFSGKRPSAISASTQETTDSFVQLDTARLHRPIDATFILASRAPVALLEHSAITRPRGRDQSRWSFLTDVFETIVLRDPAAVSHAPAPAVVDSRIANIACGVSGVLCLAVSMLWLLSWENNRRLIRDTTDAVAATRQFSPQTPVDMLPDLELLRPMMLRLHGYNRGSSPWQYHWGLYSGPRAAASLDRLYYSHFRAAVLDPALAAITGSFLQLKPGSPAGDDVYKDLKAYRAITSGACKADESLVSGTLPAMWRDAVSRNPEDQALADQQIQLYASELPFRDPFAHGIPENNDAVRNAQNYLSNLRGPDKILQAVLNQVRNVPAESLNAYAGNYGSVLAGPDQVEGPYTREGWTQVEESIRDHKLLSGGEPCVVGNRSASADWDTDAQMDAQVQSLYGKNYVDTWKQFLDRHQVIRFTGIADAAQKLHTLADNNHSPLLALIYMTSANTNVVPPDGMLGKIQQGAKGVWTKLKGQQQEKAATPATAPQSVASAFESVHLMVDPANPQRWLNPINQPYVRSLNDLGDIVQTLPPVFHRDSPIEMQQRQQALTAVGTADGAYNALAGSFPNSPDGVDVVLERLLRQPVDLARRTIEAIPVVDPPAPPPVPGPAAAPAPHPSPGADKEEQKHNKSIIDKVNGATRQLCDAEAQLDQKFPFNPVSSDDITMQDLDHLLKPGTGEYPLLAGKPDFNAAFAISGGVWTEKPEFPAIYSQPFLVTLNNYREVKDQLYGATPASAYFKLTLALDGTGHIPYELDVDGHTLRYSPGHPPAPLQLEWPPLTDAPTKLIVHNGAHGAGITTGQFTGPWSLFHLLQMADTQNGGTFVFQTVQFGHGLNPLVNEHGQPGTIQIHVTSSAGNPLARGYFSRLRCADSWALQPKNP